MSGKLVIWTLAISITIFYLSLIISEESYTADIGQSFKIDQSGFIISQNVSGNDSTVESQSNRFWDNVDSYKDAIIFLIYSLGFLSMVKAVSIILDILKKVKGIL